MLILGIETSCDETSIAVLENNRVLESKVYSQLIHAQYGGVVPEIASRAHLNKIDRLTKIVLDKLKLNPSKLGLIAVTDGPGLAGALLVGISFALGLHKSWGVPICGVNHLEGHIFSIFLENPELAFPFIALVVSGGHTAIYRINGISDYICLGQTIDDAAGEAFDKIGKLLGFPYPAGKAIEEEASKYEGNELIPFPVARLSTARLDFSFSGLKTAVKYYCNSKDLGFIKQNRPLICHSVQKAIIDSLMNNLLQAIEHSGISNVALVGGVACNRELRRRLVETLGNSIFFPSPAYCTDNGAMIALTGYLMYNHQLQRPPLMNPCRSL